jgi:hypothetical protein
MESDLTYEEKLERANDAEEMLNGRMAMLSETGRFTVNFLYKKIELKLEQIYSLKFEIEHYQRQITELEKKLTFKIQIWFFGVLLVWLLHTLGIKVGVEVGSHIVFLALLFTVPIIVHFFKIVSEVSNLKSSYRQSVKNQKSIISLLYVEFDSNNVRDLISLVVNRITKEDSTALIELYDRELIANIKHSLAENVWLSS